MGNTGAALHHSQGLMNYLCGYGEAYGAYGTEDTATAASPCEMDDAPTSAEPNKASQHFRQILADAFRAYSRAESEVHNIKIDSLIEEIRKHWRDESTVVKINVLKTKGLRQPLDALIESDGDGFIARAIDFPLYGYGDDKIEALDALKEEIESLYFDLIEDDNFIDEWRGVKAFLQQQVIDD